MDYETRYAAIRDEMLSVMTELGSRFEKSPEEYVGDEYGFEFGVDAADGKPVHVTLILEGFSGGGNVILRAEHCETRIATVAPDNHTDEVFAGWDDEDAWELKLDHIRQNVGLVGDKIAELAGSANTVKP